MPDAVVKQRTYNGCYRHKADDKRRVPVPFRWRPEESEGAMEFTLIIWPKHQAGICLRVLPPDQLAKLRADIDAMPNSDSRQISFETKHWHGFGPSQIGQRWPDYHPG